MPKIPAVRYTFWVPTLIATGFSVLFIILL